MSGEEVTVQMVPVSPIWCRQSLMGEIAGD